MITDPNIVTALQHQFPGLSEQELMNEILSAGAVYSFETQDTIIDFGEEMLFIPLILKGSIKIFRQDEQGHELFLYYLNAGETCAISLNWCMSDQISEIKAVAQEALELILIPIQFINPWMNEFPQWHNFFINAYHYRIEELIQAIDAVAFQNLDQRLHSYLLNIVANDKTIFIETTHQQIAGELNSRREVISRLLKKMERNGFVKLERNKITILENI